MKKNIAIITPYHDNYGGAEIYVKELEKYLNYKNNLEKKYNCYILTSDVEKFSDNKFIKIPKINTYKLLIKNLFELIKILKKNNIDILILNDFYISTFSIIFRVFRFKVISLIHAEIKNEIKGRKSKIGIVVKKLRFILINIGSNNILSVNKSNLKNFYPYKTYYIGNFIDLSLIEKNISCEKVFDFIFVGRLTEIKNIKYMIDIFKTYTKQYDNKSKLAIIGDGELYEDIKCQINRLNLNNNITLLGYQDRYSIFSYYKKSKCLLLFSKSEGFPTVILEALASGIPCVVSNVGSNSDIINKDNGYIILDINNKSEITSKMYSIIGNFEYFSEKCIESCSKWDKNNVLSNIERILK